MMRMTTDDRKDYLTRTRDRLVATKKEHEKAIAEARSNRSRPKTTSYKRRGRR